MRCRILSRITVSTHSTEPVAFKETIGKATGDAKLEAEGKADKVEGKVQNATGGLKDTLKK